MQKPVSKKPALHGAAAESHRKAEADTKQSKSTAAKTPQADGKSSKTDTETESRTRSR